MKKLVEKFLGRNYHLALLCIILSFTLCLYGHMTGAEFVTIATATFTGFRAGDAVVNWIYREKSGASPSPPSSPPTGTSNDPPT